MAQRTVCDVFNTATDVETYVITIEKRDTANRTVLTVVDQLTADLCPRAYTRLYKKITGGITPPPKKGGTNADEEN